MSLTFVKWWNTLDYSTHTFLSETAVSMDVGCQHSLLPHCIQSTRWPPGFLALSTIGAVQQNLLDTFSLQWQTLLSGSACVACKQLRGKVKHVFQGLCGAFEFSTTGHFWFSWYKFLTLGVSSHYISQIHAHTSQHSSTREEVYWRL